MTRFLGLILLLSFALSGCTTMAPVSLRDVRHDTRQLWEYVHRYAEEHPRMTRAQLSRVTLEDLVKGKYIPAQTLAAWRHRGMDVSVHPENFRVPGDGVVCQINEGHSLVMATKSGEIRGIIQ